MAKETLISYLYEEMTHEESVRFENHLATCSTCRTQLQEFRASQNILAAWPDEEPEQALTFVPEPASLLHGMVQWWTRLRRPAKTLGMLAGGAIATVFILSIFNVQAGVSAGEFYVRFSVWPQAQTSPAETAMSPEQQPVTRKEFDAWRTASLQLISDALENSQRIQDERLNKALAQLASQLEARRRQDLRYVGKGLQVLQAKQESKFRQTDEVLQQLIQLASYQSTQPNPYDNNR